MFDFILYPVSAILWFWHKVFGAVLGPDNGFAWALSVFFLVFSLRVLLLKPALSQIRSARKMQKFAPQIQKMREKYKGDRQRMAQEMQKLQSEHGVNPVGGCLPALLQLPVFLSLFHVLRGFKPDGQPNFVFNPDEVRSFINSSIFGAKLGNWLSQPEETLQAFGTTRLNMIAVGIPLMVIASVATFFTMRMSMKRQTETSMANPQTAMMGKFMMYVAPVGTLFSGWILPLAVVLYFMANNIWTLGQQHFLSNKVDREQERERQREIEAKKNVPKPKPGQKPVRPEHKSSAQQPETVESTAEETKQTTASVTGNAQGSKAPSGRAAGSKSQRKRRPGKQAAASKKSQKKRR